MPTIVSNGGTNPSKALTDLARHRAGKTKHLVIVMTDDEWSGSDPLLAAYKEEGRVIFGLGYKAGKFTPGIAESLERKGADQAWAITDLAAIPRLLETALIDMA